ncbi:hypothetical protein ACWGQ5_06725 [Streptomyces sp. NPDC055722]
MQVGERALHESALGVESGTVLGAAPGYQRFHAEVPNQLAVLVVVVSAVGRHHVRAAPSR